MVVLIKKGGRLTMTASLKSNGIIGDGNPTDRRALHARSILWYGLGLLWIGDGLLQAQPAMFSPAFYALFPSSAMQSLLQENTGGQPAWVMDIVKIGIHLWSVQPTLFNALALLLQIGIGLALIFGRERRFGKIGLWVSLAWSAVVWAFGEGFGGVFTTDANYFGGAPGPALLYAAGAIALLLGVEEWSGGDVARWIRRGLLLFWALMAVFQALPLYGLWTRDGLMTLFANAAQTPQPLFLAGPIQVLALWTYQSPVAWNGIFTAVFLLIAAAFLFPSWPRSWKIAMMAWLAWSWWFGQDFGGILGGNGTDFSSAPLLALLTAASWAAQSSPRRISPMRPARTHA